MSNGASWNKQTALRLNAWFQTAQRVLPWRTSPECYRVWVSEIMLQQTQVATVIPYFERFLCAFPTVNDLANAGEDEVLRQWSGLGYYSRARNLHRGARQIVAKGRWPANRDEWLEVPGVGPYTAGAIASISLNEVVPILDGNVERVLSRFFRAGGVKNEAWKKRLWAYAERAVQVAHRAGVSPSSINQALMELGATICAPRKPRCSVCPLIKACFARSEGDAEAFPPKKARALAIRLKEQVALHVNARGQCWVTQNSEGRWRKGLWDLPVVQSTAVPAFEVSYVVTRHRVTRSVILKKGRPQGRGKWVLVGQILRKEIPVGASLMKSIQAAQERQILASES